MKTTKLCQKLIISMKSLVFFSLLTLLLIGCSSSGGGSGEDTTELEGTWVQECSKDSTFQFSSIFSGTSFANKQEYFKDNGCQNLEYVTEYYGMQFSIGKSFESKDGEVKELSLTASNVKSKTTLKSASIVEYYNKEKECGKEDWKINETVDNCPKQEPKQDNSKRIFQIKDGKDGTKELRYEPWDGKENNLPPLDKATPYIKK